MGKKIEILEEESTKPKEKPKPPPVPPRKILKKKSVKQQAPQPPEAELYLNACEETTLTNGKHEYESDDTASTISTVIDKLSLSSSNFSSELDLTQSNSETDLAKVLKPFILLEKEFNIKNNIEISQIIQKSSPARKDYENVDLKTKDVAYENIEIRPKVLVGGEPTIPTPKPRISTNIDQKSASLEPKRRTAIPTPRKSNSFKEEKEPPVKKTVTETKSLPINESIVTKIPKALNLVFNRTVMSRSKTETDMKSKIPVKKMPLEIESPKKTLEKQKSETDLRKSNLPTLKQVKSPPTKLVLHRSNSTEIRYNYAERSVDEPRKSPQVEKPVVSVKAPESAKPPTPRARGPKPKPPERVDSLKKIEKPNVIKIKDIAEPSPLPQEPQMLMQTFKVQQPQPTEVQKEPMKLETPTTKVQPPSQPQSPSSPQNKEVKFKIQTYESSMAERESSDKKKTIFTFTDVNGNDSENSFYILPEEQKKTHTFYLNPRPAVNAVTNMKLESLNDTNDEVHECPLVVGKCTKVMDKKSTYYSSSSEEEDEVEEGEKLGPPELVNGPGPSEAYFNMFWHANLLPTIGEVEEEMSSLEPG